MLPDPKTLFFNLYGCSEEKGVEDLLKFYSLLDSPENWAHYGGTDSNFSVVENQPSGPVPALIEKVTNGIDAILMRRCIENGIDPRSPQAPRSIMDAVEQFFPDYKNWDIVPNRRRQAEDLQILADGPRLKPSLVVYDNGEGQLPEAFEDTFLSLLRSNKNEIHFVHGQYNMGGTGAVAFCGDLRYQLIGSKRFDDPTAPFGFTLIRKHPLTPVEQKKIKSTWYEFLTIDGKIPSFPIDELDLGLYKRNFTTGTVLKLYSYDLPSGARSVISRDLNQSINEFLFAPALPLFTIDTPERYPDDRNLQRELYGLKRRLEEDDSKYIEIHFSEEGSEQEIGKFKVTCYVFRTRVEERTAQETRDTIGREFFKNNMSVLFSVNGQVHGHYTSEFITRTLKFHLLKNHLLIHVDCTEMNPEFRRELFMASRDRLKEGKESRKLRAALGDLLGKGRLQQIHKKRKASITLESSDADDLLRNFARNLSFHNDLAKLFKNTLDIEDKSNGQEKKKKPKRRKPENDDTNEFNPKRYPTIFKIDVSVKGVDGIPMVKIPKGGERSIKFSTDVEDQYFDRSNDPGELKIGLLGPGPTQVPGGDAPGLPGDIEENLDIVKSSPVNGRIRVLVNPTDKVEVGDTVKLKASLSSPGGDLEEVFYVKISQPEKKKQPSKKKNEEPVNQLGLPKMQLIFREAQDGKVTWEWFETKSGVPMDHDTVVFPLVTGEVLETIFINMDSNVLLSHRSKLKGQDAIETADKRYISAVYYHTLFLYSISKNRNFGIVQQNNGVSGDKHASVELNDYLADLFQNHYAQFLITFDTQELIAALEE